MGILDDTLQFFKDLFNATTLSNQNAQKLNNPKAIEGAGVMARTLTILKEDGQDIWDAVTLAFVGDLVTDLLTKVEGEDTLQSVIMESINKHLIGILGAVLIERPTGGGTGADATAEQELEIFARSASEAQGGAAVATLALTVLNMAAASADAVVQGATLGQARLFQELVQNIIWSLGLADLGGLSFRPQITASFAPLLDRHYNSLAQAQIPGTGDLIRFLVREVFQPDRRAALEADQTPQVLREFMKQKGFAEFWTDSYWAAHWNLLSTTQLNEATHRGVISEDEWERQIRLNDVVPEGVPWLKEIIFSPYTRVDVRRMGDLGLLDDEELLQAYADIGYFAPKQVNSAGRWRAQFVSPGAFDATIHTAQGLVIFTRIFNAMPDIRRRLRNGFIRPENVQSEIEQLGVPEATARRLTEGLVKATDLGEAESIKALTTAQIVRGAKTSLISFNQGLFLLQELGWSSARAEFMLRLRLAPEDAPTATALGERLISRE